MSQAAVPPSRLGRSLRCLALALLTLVAAGCGAWACGALYFDLPAFRGPAAVLFAALLLAAVLVLSATWQKFAAVFAAFLLVLVWWRTLAPSNQRSWQPDVAQTAWAEIAGDLVTIHNVRHCDYRTELDYTPRWETRTFRLSAVTGLDLFLAYWGSPYMAHPIASFQFQDAPPLCFSIETRKEVGEGYSALAGLYRHFELIYIVADERDVVRLRTNFRHGEDVYLFRTAASPEQARARLREYLATLNGMHAQPRWYNALTTNCTTAVRTQRAAAERSAFDWRLIVNGKLDELLYERGVLSTGGLPFSELKARACVNPPAPQAGAAADFSQRIRLGPAGF
jgi:hypothetical protein